MSYILVLAKSGDIDKVLEKLRAAGCDAVETSGNAEDLYASTIRNGTFPIVVALSAKANDMYPMSWNMALCAELAFVAKEDSLLCTKNRGVSYLDGTWTYGEVAALERLP